MEIIIVILTLLATGLGILVMVQQKQLSAKQLNLYLFDKYFRIYSFSEDFIVKLMMGWVTIEECAEFFRHMKEAVYLLDPKLNDFITNIHTAGLELAGLNNSITIYERNKGNLSERNIQERNEFLSKKAKLIESIISYRGELKIIFAKVLKVN